MRGFCQVCRARDTVKQAWVDLRAVLASPPIRRRLAPVVGIVALAVVLVGYLYALQTGKAPITPGIAIGAPAWAILALVAVITLAATVVHLLQRRK